LSWRIDPDHARLTPAARGSCSLPWIEFPGLLINPLALFADFHSFAVVTLIGRHKFDAALAMPGFVLLHKIYNPQAGLLLACEWLARIIRSVFNGAQQRLSVRFVV
jgi:hypothetical protein